jgi:hypothetical protein
MVDHINTDQVFLNGYNQLTGIEHELDFCRSKAFNRIATELAKYRIIIQRPRKNLKSGYLLSILNLLHNINRRKKPFIIADRMRFDDRSIILK